MDRSLPKSLTASVSVSDGALTFTGVFSRDAARRAEQDRVARRDAAA